MELTKPPVIEVGVEFHFDPRPDKQPWDPAVAVPFIDLFQGEYPHVEVIQEEKIRIEKRTPDGTPKAISGKISLDRVRARNEEGSRWLQVGNDLLVYSFVRKGETYPGFRELCTEALHKLDSYVEHFQPVAVHRTALTYLDLIEIPVPAGATIQLEDYFRLRVETPEETFGPIGYVSLRLFFPQTETRDQLLLWFDTVPTKPGEGILRFQMHWKCICEDVASLNKEEIRLRLDRAHRRLVDCFRDSFTERGWALFGPIGSS
ncbi:MAG: hypothetical protein KatS3mg105_1340 [Gemmatales bacterium]|nr:MAG: hypothetical protein KatS3mg105_1340 [Gemmatales bacterium]